MQTDLRPLAEFIAEQELRTVDSRVIKIDESQYLMLDREVHDIEHLAALSKIIKPETVGLRTLQGLVDFFGAEICETQHLFVRIATPNIVFAESKIRLLDGSLPVMAEVTYDGPEQMFGEWMGAGKFVTWILSSFIPNEDSGELLALLGRGVKIEAIRQVSDDGVATQLKRSRGARVEWTGDARFSFTLRPRRTFPEVEQPNALCVLRFENNSDDEPVLMKLVESDGGAWRATAAASIGAWLAERLKDVPILR